MSESLLGVFGLLVGITIPLASFATGLLNERTGHPNGQFYSLADRFHNEAGDNDLWAPFASDGRANTHVFVSKQHRVSGGEVELVAEDVFPSALRITVDVYDAARRLERPVRHVMVIPVGR